MIKSENALSKSSLWETKESLIASDEMRRDGELHECECFNNLNLLCVCMCEGGSVDVCFFVPAVCVCVCVKSLCV